MPQKRLVSPVPRHVRVVLFALVAIPFAIGLIPPKLPIAVVANGITMFLAFERP
jgi:hypothetical protein